MWYMWVCAWTNTFIEYRYDESHYLSDLRDGTNTPKPRRWLAYPLHIHDREIWDEDDFGYNECMCENFHLEYIAVDDIPFGPLDGRWICLEYYINIDLEDIDNEDLPYLKAA